MSRQEKRSAPRKAQCQRVALHSELIGNDIEGVSRDISATGVRVTLPPDLCTRVVNWPKQLTLRMLMDHVEVDCEIVRLRGHQLALRFVSAFRPTHLARHCGPNGRKRMCWSGAPLTCTVGS